MLVCRGCLGGLAAGRRVLRAQEWAQEGAALPTRHARPGPLCTVGSEAGIGCRVCMPRGWGESVRAPAFRPGLWGFRAPAPQIQLYLPAGGREREGGHDYQGEGCLSKPGTRSLFQTSES